MPMMETATCNIVEASFVKYPREHFQPDNGVNDYDKQHKERNVKERNHRHENSVDDNLQA